MCGGVGDISHEHELPWTIPGNSKPCGRFDVVMAQLKWWLVACLLRKKLRVREREIRNVRFSFSANGEDVVLDTLLTGPGRYLEIGGHQPVAGSNTYLLYLRGWHGLVVEPNPKHAGDFSRRRPRDQVVEAAICDFEGEVWYDEVTPHDSANQIRRLESQPGPLVVRSRKIRSMTMEVLLRSSRYRPEEFRLFSIDAEGCDLEILRSTPWGLFQPEVVCVEALADGVRRETMMYLGKKGYEFHAATGPSLIFRKTEAASPQGRYKSIRP